MKNGKICRVKLLKIVNGKYRMKIGILSIFVGGKGEAKWKINM